MRFICMLQPGVAASITLLRFVSVFVKFPLLPGVAKTATGPAGYTTPIQTSVPVIYCTYS
jgi:hypothetical protein